MDRDWCEIVADLARSIGGRSRFKLRTQTEPESWGEWLIAPTSGYLEISGVGPYSVRELEWIDVEPGGDGLAEMVTAFATHGITASIAGTAVRVWPDP